MKLINTYKKLTEDKKLTLGFIGGSITYGSSAAKAVAGKPAGIELSYVNRIASWFKITYPDATIQTVNAGVSDTATNFGIFRLENTLMNTNGHDMPDIVFIEFTTNDWFYSTQTKEDLLLQIESLIHNVWAINPYVEIVFILTQVALKSDSVDAYKEIAEKYNISVIDVGSALRKAKEDKCGKMDEDSSDYYYTVDNLHPSAAGYAVYFDTIKPVLEESLNFKLNDRQLCNYGANLPASLYNNLIDKPAIITADKIGVCGNAEKIDTPIYVDMYGTDNFISKSVIVNNCINITGDAKVSSKFSGTVLGLLFNIKNKKEFSMRYQIDGGEWLNFAVNSHSFAFQMYDHAQTFMLSHRLSDVEHEVNIEFLPGSETYLGGLLVNGK